MNIIELLENADSDTLRFLLNQYKIQEEPTPETLLDAMETHGNKFIADLYILLNYGSNNSGPLLPDGSFTQAEADNKTKTAKRADTWNKIKEGLNNFSNNINNSLDAYGRSKALIENNQKSQQQQQTKSAIDKDNSVWYIAIAAIAIVVIAILILKKN